MDDEVSKAFYMKMQKPGLTSFQRTALHKKVHNECKKVHTCPHCGVYNGTVKKKPKFPLEIIHDKYK